MSVGMECRQILFSAHYVPIGFTSWCSGVRGDLSQVADGFMCKRCDDGTIHEADLAEDLVVDGEKYAGVKSFF